MRLSRRSGAKSETRLTRAFLPLRLGDTVLGTLAVAWTHERDDVPADELGLITAFAGQCTQALARIRADEQRQAVGEQLRRPRARRDDQQHHRRG